LPKYPIFHNDKILPVAQLLLALGRILMTFLPLYHHSFLLRPHLEKWPSRSFSL